MSTKLSYFDFDGSRGLECRLALTVAGVAFVDDRIARERWPELKPTTPFGGLPILSEGDRRIARSNAILTYIGRKHGLHPADAWTAAEHEGLMQSVEDLRSKLPASEGKSAEQLATARGAFANGWLKQWASTVSARIAGPFLEGEKLHVADLKLYVITRAILNGTYDHVPASALDAAPKLTKLAAAAEAHPVVAAYLAARKR